MDGTETGWGRPAEPAPRWRALLDRALLGGRAGDQADADDRRGDEPRRSSGAAGRAGRRSAGNGYQGRAAPAGYPTDGYDDVEPPYRSDGGSGFPRSDGGSGFPRSDGGSGFPRSRYGAPDDHPPGGYPADSEHSGASLFTPKSAYPPVNSDYPVGRSDYPAAGADYPSTGGAGRYPAAAAAYGGRSEYGAPDYAAADDYPPSGGDYRSSGPDYEPRGGGYLGGAYGSGGVDYPADGYPATERPSTGGYGGADDYPAAGGSYPSADPAGYPPAGSYPTAGADYPATGSAYPSVVPDYRSAPEPAAASRYAALDTGYRGSAGYPPAEPPSVAGYPALPEPPVATGHAAAPDVPVVAGYAAVAPIPVASGYAGIADVPVTGYASVSGPPAPAYGAVSELPPAGYAPVSGAPADSRYGPLDGGAELASGPASAAGRVRPAVVEWRESRLDSEVERAVGVLRRDLGTPRVLAFANPKGGVHKTTATVLAAATIGSVRGRGVLAWDDNELRGTLGLRAGSARHARTIRHLIADLPEVELRHGPDLTDRLDDYLRHASDGSYDVLAGEENSRFAARLDEYTVRRVLELLRRTHQVICVDTGNNVESANWRTVLQAADQLVVTTVPREDAAFAADWMLDLLHEVGMGELAANAVTLLSCPNPDRSPLLDDLQRHFATRTRGVAVVPYDPLLETGSSIEYGELQHETRQAWLRAAAMMVEPFAR